MYRTPAPLTGRRLLTLLPLAGSVLPGAEVARSARDRARLGYCAPTEDDRQEAPSQEERAVGASLRVVVIFRFALNGSVLLVLHLLSRQLAYGITGIAALACYHYDGMGPRARCLLVRAPHFYSGRDPRKNSF